jgi:hypothetical protein
MIIHDPQLVFHFEPRRAVAEVVDADVAAFIGQVRVEYAFVTAIVSFAYTRVEPCRKTTWRVG